MEGEKRHIGWKTNGQIETCQLYNAERRRGVGARQIAEVSTCRTRYDRDTSTRGNSLTKRQSSHVRSMPDIVVWPRWGRKNEEARDACKLWVGGYGCNAFIFEEPFILLPISVIISNRRMRKELWQVLSVGNISWKNSSGSVTSSEETRRDLYTDRTSNHRQERTT